MGSDVLTSGQVDFLLYATALITILILLLALARVHSRLLRLTVRIWQLEAQITFLSRRLNGREGNHHHDDTPSTG